MEQWSNGGYSRNQTTCAKTMAIGNKRKKRRTQPQGEPTVQDKTPHTFVIHRGVWDVRVGA